MFIISMALFIIRALCLPLSTSNENVHKLCDTHRLCVELHDKNFKFDEQVYNEYLNTIEDSKNRAGEMNDCDIEWRGTKRPRHMVVGFLVHGFHHLLCKDQNFHKRTDACTCKLCDETIRLEHMMECPSLTGRLACRYGYLTSHPS